RGRHPDAGLRSPGTGLIFLAEPPAELLGTDSLDAVGHAVEFVWLGIGHGATGGPGPSAGPVADRAAARRGGRPGERLSPAGLGRAGAGRRGGAAGGGAFAGRAR